MEVTSYGELERQTPEGDTGHPLGDLCAKLRHWPKPGSQDPLDETGVAALTSLPRKDWAEDDPAVLRNSPSPLSPLHNHPRTWGGGSGKEIGAMIGIGLDQLQFANYELD
ncbi:hypothetical protein EMCRGX_G002815 [Ephydatia muelleri]